MNFENAFDLVLRTEGGLANDPDDNGGLTKFGISIKAYPELGEEGIRTLTEADAKAIYHRDYWVRCYCDDLPPQLRLLVFDYAVNSGRHRAAKALQYLCDAEMDGVMGPETVEAVNRFEGSALQTLIEDYLRARLHYIQSLSTYSKYGKGWERRLFRMAMHCGITWEIERGIMGPGTTAV